MESSIALSARASIVSVSKPLLAIVLMAVLFSSETRAQRSGAPLEQLNLHSSGLALDGYDPVAYFPEGGSLAVEGSKQLFVTIRGATYRFHSKKNRELFLEDPEKFEPAYGGWCAFAMAKGEKVEVDPESFLIEKGHLLVFYDGLFADTRKSWLKKGEGKLEPLATMAWGKLLGREHPVRARAKNAKLGLNGLDPTTVRKGSEAQSGLPIITTRIGDMEYRFANRANREAFVEAPESYLGKQDGSGSRSRTQ